MKYLLPVLFLFILSCDSDGDIVEVEGCTDVNACNFNIDATIENNSCLEFDCAGACNENVELWGECYSIETTTSLLIQNGMATGTIPSEIGNLTNLTWLAFFNNPDLSGPIPPEIGNLINLTYLDIGLTQVTGEIPQEIGNLTNLETLGLDQNQLTGEIPSEIGGMINLTAFSASHNQLSGAIPPEIGSLPNLHSLWLSQNDLTSVPEEIVLLNLTYFDVGDNQITSLPDNLCDACTFDTVNQTDCMMLVYGNQICEEHHFDCLDSFWNQQDQSSCCEGPNGESNWITCP